MLRQSYGNAMNSTNRERYSIFYGSHVLLAAWIGGVLNIMVVVAYSFGVFFDALMQEFSWSRWEISLAFCEIRPLTDSREGSDEHSYCIGRFEVIRPQDVFASVIVGGNSRWATIY